MKRNKILKILLLTLLSSCSSNASSTNEAKSNSENSCSIKNSTSQDYDIIQCDESGELLTLVENPKQMSLSKEIKIKVFLGHFWHGQDDLNFISDESKEVSFKLELSYAKMKLINNGYEFSGYRTSYIIAELPNFNTDEYDITTGEREHACDIYYKKSIELSIDTSLFQLSDDECGYLSFSIKVFDSQNKEIDVSSRGSTDIGIYFIINENDIKFDYDYRNLE